MSSVTNNKAQTKLISLPEQVLPVVIAWRREKKDRSGVFILGGLRQLDPRDLDLYLTNKKKFEEIYGGTETDEKELLFAVQLADALAAKSLPRVRNAFNRFIGSSEADKAVHHPPGSNTLRRPIAFVESLSTRFNMRTHGATPIVYWSDRAQRLAFGLFCPNISIALFLLAIQKVGVSSMGHCKGCQGVLIADRANKRFCDDNCRSRFYMRQLRARKKKGARKSRKGKKNL